MIIVIDNQSAHIKKFKRNYLSEQDFDFIFFDHNQPIVLSDKAKISGIILSGGKGNPYEPLNLTANFVALMGFDVPILGFCLGHEIISVAYGGRIKKLSKKSMGKEQIVIQKKEDKIFDGIVEDTLMLQKSHDYYVSQLPKDFVVLGSSKICETEIIKHKDKPIYGFQSHPEVSGEKGIKIIENFLKMCGVL
ncbi:MAG: gamma-glutamyl-gamma-aminobutyrate hydrolase family protein [Clostridiales bacterium]|nr:gamma-glutamyl-gamma-aminobutyrate hydrolase family protein [Clostridiales bacterium]